MVSISKQKTVEDLLSFLASYPNLALIRFDKTTHATLEQLRKTLIKNAGRLKVVKNSILQKALTKAAVKNKKLQPFEKKAVSILKDNTALLGLPANWSNGLNAFSQFISKEKSLSFKIGLLDQEVYLAEDMVRIANLPSHTQLIAKIIGSLKSPMSKTVYSMKFNTNKLVYVLKAKGVKN